MNIRRGLPEDSAEIAPLLLLAMEDIVYKFIGAESKKKALDFLETMIFQKGNQYSHENCWIIEDDIREENESSRILGVSLVYEGAELNKLRFPVAFYIKENFNRDFNPEDETQPGEIYIDCVAVDPNSQGRGIGSMMFKFLIDYYVKKQKLTLGLLVDNDNPSAKKLYLKLGFKVVSQKSLVGKQMDHMQIEPSTI